MAKKKTQKKSATKPSINFWVALFGFIILFMGILAGWDTFRPVKPVIIGDWEKHIEEKYAQQLAKETPYTPQQLPKLIEKTEFKKRQYNPSDFLLDNTQPKIKYPTEVTNFNDSDLISLSCTQTYGDWGSTNQFSTSTPTGRDEYSLSNEKLENYIKVLSQKVAPEKITWINSCTTENGKTFVFFAETAHGAGVWSGSTQLGIDDGNGIHTVIEGLGPGCSALQLVKNDYMYVSCGESEGGGAVYSISQVNLANRSVTHLLYCVRTGDKVSCQ